MIRGAKACPFCGNLEGLVWFNDSSESEDNNIDEILSECGTGSICCSIHDGGCGGTSGYYSSEERFY